MADPTTLPKSVLEPVRAVANRIVAVAVALGVILGALNSSGAVDFVPAQYRDRVTAAIGTITLLLAGVVKYGGEIARQKVTPVVTAEAQVQAAREGMPGR